MVARDQNAIAREREVGHVGEKAVGHMGDA